MKIFTVGLNSAERASLLEDTGATGVGFLEYKGSFMDEKTKSFTRRRVELLIDSSARLENQTNKELETTDALTELMALEMMSRQDTARLQDLESRRLKWRRILRFWTNQIHESSPDLVYFSTIPHEVHEFAIWTVCRVGRVRSKCAIEIPFLDSWGLTENYLELPLKTSKSDLEIKSLHFPKRDMREKIATLRSQKKWAPPRYVELRSDSRILKNKLGANRALKSIKMWWFSAKAICRGKTGQDFILRQIAVARKIINSVYFHRASYVNKLVQDSFQVADHLDTDSDFAIFFLHYEPELMVNPLSNGMTQVDCVRAFRKLIPKGMRILVAEHPSQKDPSMSGFFVGKPVGFYAEINSIDNVVLVDGATITQAQRDAAFAIGTITGTAGFEQAIRGGTVVIYGHVWYQSLPNVIFRPKSFGELLAIREIDKKTLGHLVDESMEVIRLSSFWLPALKVRKGSEGTDKLKMNLRGFHLQIME